jgi:phage-related protein
MDKNSCVIYAGSYYTLEWYYDKNGNSAVYNYFLKTTQEQKRKFLMLAKKMGDFGKIFDITKFRNEGDGIFAFKPQPDRYLSFFTDGKKIIVTNGFLKKTDKLPKREKELAIKMKNDYFQKKLGGK